MVGSAGWEMRGRATELQEKIAGKLNFCGLMEDPR